MEARIISADWSILPQELLSDKFDLLLNAYSPDDVDNAELFEWSDPYHDYGYLVVVKTDNNDIKGVEDLKGKKIISYIDFAEYIQTEYPNVAEHIITEDPSVGYEKVENAEVDAFLYDAVSVKYVLKTDNKFKAVGELLEPGQYNIAAGKGKTELIKSVNNALKNILDNAEYNNMLKKYF